MAQLKNIVANKPSGTFKLQEILADSVILQNYVNIINSWRLRTLSDIITNIHSICPQLKTNYKKTFTRFLTSKRRDKGMLGKLVEKIFFGIDANTISAPDLSLHKIDIKTTHFKRLKNGGLNAKERLTLTNCGSTADYHTFSDISINPDIEKIKVFPKVSKALIFVFLHDKGKYNTYKRNLEKKLLCIVNYDYFSLPKAMLNQIYDDYSLIRKLVHTQKITQRGQSYLHIHPHGNSGTKVRALGFKNKFVTKLVGSELRKFYGYNIITYKGRSLYIKPKYFNIS